MSRARMFMDCDPACREADAHTMMPGCVGYTVKYVMVDGRPDQLDVQVSMAINSIRRQANVSRVNVLHLPQRKYKTITPDMVVRLEP